MTYRPPNFAMKAGSCARNHATASRRAVRTSLCWAGGRSGNSDATDSSEASVVAISLRNRSPFFGPDTVMKDCIATLSSTASAEGGGRSLATLGGSIAGNKTLTTLNAGPTVRVGSSASRPHDCAVRYPTFKHPNLGREKHATRELTSGAVRQAVTPSRAAHFGDVA